MKEEIRRIKRTKVHQGNIIDMYCDEIEFPDGRKANWDYFHHKGAAAVVPVTDDGKILMVRQFRNALDRFTLEIPAGALDFAGEEGISCAARELEEETGFRSTHLEWLITIRTMVAFCNERVEVFVADHLEQSKQNLDEDEFIDVYAYSIAELKEMIFTGKIEDSKTIAALLAYDTKYHAAK